MSQIVYTELEGQPLRWPYLQAVPIEGEQVVDNTPKTWSISTTPTTLIQNTNTGTVNQIYGSNMVGQTFATSQNALKVTAIQLYGYKSGSPPNPLIVEIRDIKELESDNNSVLETQYLTIFTVPRSYATSAVYYGFAQAMTYTQNFMPYRFGFIVDDGENTVTFTIRTGSPSGTIVYGPIQMSFNSDDTNYVYIDLPNPPMLNANTTYYFTCELSTPKGIRYNGDIIPGGGYWTKSSSGSWIQQSSTSDYSCQICIMGGAEAVYGSRKIAMPHTTFYDIGKIEFIARRVGNPSSSLIVELRLGSPDGELLSYVSIPPENIPTTNYWISDWTSITFNYSEIYHGKKTFYIVFRTTGGDSNNHYLIGCGCQVSPKIWINDGSGWSESADKSTYLNVYAKRIYPGDNVLATGQIPPASVGTSSAWINISLSTPIALRYDTVYSLVVYTIGGDSSNRYNIHNGGTGGTPAGVLEYFLSSTDSGGSWTINTGTDLSFKIDGVQYSKIYSGSRAITEIKAPAIPILALKVMAQTSSSMEFAGFDDYALTSPITTSSSTSQTKVTAFPATSPRLRNTAKPSTLSWEIWAAGAGLATKAITQFYAYYNKNPVTPIDFGFTELYILRITAAENDTLVMINEHKAAMIYLPNNGDSYVAPTNFNFPASIITVLSGKPIVDMIGLV